MLKSTFNLTFLIQETHGTNHNEHNPSEERLKELGVANWDIWEKEVSEFPIDFDETETAYILEGEILVTPEGGEPVRILPGDLLFSRKV